MMGSLSAASGYLWVVFGSILFIIGSSVFGDHDVGNLHDISHGGNSDNNEGPGVLSIRNVSMFFLGFGSAGALAIFYTGSQQQAVFWGCIAGVAMTMLTYLVAKFFYRQQASTESSASSLVGKVARVTMSVKPGIEGQISVADQYGTPAVFSAFSADDNEYQEGTIVQISGFQGITALIKSS